ncbi:MAG: glycine--tRNA ligase subunit beta [Desulfobacca sp. RBG_16_60_12]|nr:MAG: glycine--tRNA ligase subunit beta [Desulfobacca sp. RBG_16_60_12]
MAKELLLEIGTEEIPARFIPKVLEEMAASFRELMGQELIAVGDIATWGTPRRLALVARDLAATQADTETEELGPPKAVAFDAAGKPTPAALGFAKKQGVAVSDLMEVDTPRGVYLAVRKSTTGRPTSERLPEFLPGFILGLSFPKSMRWGSETITFARPIHWILARYGGAVVDFAVGDVTSGGLTFGHRFLAPGAVEVADAQAYVTALKAARVIVDPVARRALLAEELAQAAAGVKGEVVPNPGLLEENTFLVESPSVVVGNFEDKFLALPDEVLITSMREHQRYFSLRGADGRLLPHFIAVNNTLTRDPDVVRQGHERVIRARLADAMFFFQEDSKTPLAKRVDALKGVVFHSLLGTSYEKMERFRELAVSLARQLAPELEAAVYRAATLCKADIVTEMVGEFPSLQGVMGRQYAKLSGEPPEVAEALFTHYLPRHADDELPQDKVGALVGLADRLDTICGCFGVGLNPTGAADPYGLRRHALAVIRIVRSLKLHLDLVAAVAVALELLKDKISRAMEETALEVLDFFQTRLQHLLLVEGFDHETITAVLAAGGRDVVDAVDKVRALAAVRQSPEFPALAVAFKRVINIAQGAEPGEVDPLLFEQPEENILFESTELMELEVTRALKSRDYPGVCRALASLRGPVDAFFEKVMVMAEDTQLRRNRLALLLRISRTFLLMADFSKITTS